MKAKVLTSTALVVLLAAGCDTGSRDGDAFFGPGSTGAQPGSTGTTGGGATGGGGAGGGGTGGGGGGGGTVGNFSGGPAMTTPRMQHTATLLPDGRVLVTGGSDGQSPLPSTELYDPTANAWEDLANIAANQNDAFMLDATGQFATLRQLHTATLMASGSVLVTGGFGAERLDQSGQPIAEMLKTAYVFDPLADKYTKVAEMNENRGWHQAALLSNGNVIVVAGMDQNVQATLKTADVYDPNTDQWTNITPGQAADHQWAQTLTIVNQTITISGVQAGQGQQGLSVTGLPSTRVEAYDVQGQSFIPANDNVDHRFDQGANVMSTGNALIVGGMGLDSSQQQFEIKDTTETFDATAQTFTLGPTLQVPRAQCTVSEIGTTADQLIVGGVDPSGAPTPVCEVWSVLNNAMIGTVTMAQERVSHRSVTLQNGQILVIGGQDANGDPTDSTEIHTR